MDTTWWIVIAVVAALVVLALVAWGYGQSRRRTALKDQFGPEYDRTVVLGRLPPEGRARARRA